MGLYAPLEWIERVDDVISGRDILRILGFLKDGVAVRLSKRAVEFSDLIRSDQFGSRPTEISWDLRHHKMRCVRVRSYQHSMVSVGLYDLCLSPRVTKGWTQKEISSFVSEMTASVCIMIIIIIIIIINIIIAIQLVDCIIPRVIRFYN